MTMNFTEFLEALESPIYQIEGNIPKCKKGYKWDNDIGGCVPVGSKNKESKTDTRPEEGEGFNAIGSNGMDGGYALAEPPIQKEEVYKIGKFTDPEERKKIKEKLAANAERHRDTHPIQDIVKLGPGEYKVWDKNLKKWVSRSAIPRRKPRNR